MQRQAKKIERIFLRCLSTLLCTIPFVSSVSWSAEAPLPITVSTTQAQMQTIPKVINAYGHMDAINQVDLSFEVSGRINQIFITSGRVKKNEVILSLSDDADQAKLKALQANLALDKSNQERAAALKAYGGISEAALEANQAKVAEDQANLEQQQALINQKKLSAPFDGVLGDMKFSVGAYVTSGQPIVTLVQEAPLKVRYAVPSSQKENLEIGQTTRVTVNHKTYPGLVNFISPEIDVDTGTLTIEAEIDNPDYALTPGEFVEVEHVLDPNQKLLVIPSVSVMTDLLGQYVYTVSTESGQSVAHKRYISTGLIHKNVIQILKGISSGDRVIVAGQQKVTDGALVEVEAQH
jgi:membrane fusion protein (multidrug efflux system)